MQAERLLAVAILGKAVAQQHRARSRVVLAYVRFQPPQIQRAERQLLQLGNGAGRPATPAGVLGQAVTQCGAVKIRPLDGGKVDTTNDGILMQDQESIAVIAGRALLQGHDAVGHRVRLVESRGTGVDPAFEEGTVGQLERQQFVLSGNQGAV